MDQNLLSLSSKSINGGWHESEQIDSTNPSYSQRGSLAHILHGAGIFINTSESASLPVILVPYNNPYMGYLNLGRLPGFTCAKNKPCCSLAWCPHHALHHPKGAEVTRSRRTPARSRSINWWSHGQSWNSWDSIGISWDSIGISCDFLGIEMGFSWDVNSWDFLGILLEFQWDFFKGFFMAMFIAFFWFKPPKIRHFSDLRSASPAPLAHPILGENSSPYYHLVMTNSLPWYRWPIEIDGLPDLKMVIFHGYVK